MIEKITELIHEHSLRNQEVFEQASELSKINKSKLSKEEKRLLEDQLLLLEQENNLRTIFIYELRDLI